MLKPKKCRTKTYNLNEERFLLHIFLVFLKQICYQNKFGILPYVTDGGSYPYASYNTAGNVGRNDYCMAVGVMSKGSTAHGWSQNANSYDSPSSDSDWPNKSFNHQYPHLTVWLK